MKPLIVTKPKPRNPFVAPSLQRAAGAHRRAESARRQGDQRRLDAELRQLHPPQPVTSG